MNQALKVNAQVKREERTRRLAPPPVDETVWQGVGSQEQDSSQPPETPESQAESPPELPSIIDISGAIAEAECILIELGWGAEQKRQHLLQIAGCDRTDRLTEGDWLAWVSYLRRVRSQNGERGGTGNDCRD